MIYYVIPARQDSERFPFKNRILFKHTAETIPSELCWQVIVSTNDPVISAEAARRLFVVHPRPERLAGPEVSMRDVLLDVASRPEVKSDDDIVTLYLTYPGREFNLVQEALKFYWYLGARSLLCAMPHVGTSPFCCAVRTLREHGTYLFPHGFFRCQDYPEVFEVSHAVVIVKAGRVVDLHDNLWCPETVFLPIDRMADVDNLDDYEEWRASQ